MLIRRRPAAARSWATRPSVEPFVVSDRSAPSGASLATRTGSRARTVGSPPVSRMEVNPNCSTKTLATRSISSNVRSSSRGNHCIPSAGMQYPQRKLHRSVTEMRRSRWTRP